MLGIGGRAVADVLFEDVSPAGKLPITFPKSLDQLPAFDDYSMDGRTYRYMTQEPLFPFGFGLSYSQIEYKGLNLEKTRITQGESLRLTVSVTNKGPVETQEVVQFYLSDLEASTIVPIHHLIGFEKVKLAAGETETIVFTITPEMMSFFNDGGSLTLETRTFRIEIGSCSPGKRGQELDAPSSLTAFFTVA